MDTDPEVLAKLIEESGQSVGNPRTPEEVAANCFAFLDNRDTNPIEPRHFSHPDDERRAEEDARKPRADVVLQMGRMTSAMWK